MDKEVVKYTTGYLDAKICLLKKRVSKLQGVIEKADKVKNLHLFLNSVSSSPLKEYAESRLLEDAEKALKAQKTLEKSQEELKKLTELREKI